MFYRTGDPLADYDRYDREYERHLDSLPRCSECDEPIQDEEYYEFGDVLICPECLKENHRRWTEDYET